MIARRLAASILLAALPLGCTPNVALPSSTGTTTGPDGSSSGTGGSSGTVVPMCTSLGPPDGTGSVTFAVTRLYLGDTRRDGTPDPENAWKAYGFDLDGKVSTPASTDLCQPKVASVKERVYQDGDGGIDNAFGVSVLPILSALAPPFSQGVNDAIAQGSFTLLLDLDKLGPAADQAPLVVRAYRAGALGSAPKLDGTDAWPVRAASLTDASDPSTAVEHFPMSWLCQDTWQSGLAGELTLDLVMTGVPFQLHIHHAFLQMDLDPGRDDAVNGTIAGILDPEEILHEIFQAALIVEPDLCMQTHTYDAYQSLREQLDACADTLLDGSQDPQKTCQGITIGLGFDAHRAQRGPVDTTPPPVPPCMVP